METAWRYDRAQAPHVGQRVTGHRHRRVRQLADGNIDTQSDLRQRERASPRLRRGGAPVRHLAPEVRGFHRRHPQARVRPLLVPRAYRAGDAAGLVHQWTAGATIVGVVPRFDAECLADMFARHGVKPAWNDDLVDVVPLATAAIRAAGREPASDVASLSRQCGVKPPTAAQRHTALGDARWAMRWYDKLVQM